MTGIDPHFIAGLQFDADQIARSLKNQHLPSRLLLEAQSSVRQRLADFENRAVRIVPECFDHGIGLIDEHLSPDLQIGRRHPRIDIGIIFGSTDHDASESLSR